MLIGVVAVLAVLVVVLLVLVASGGDSSAVAGTGNGDGGKLYARFFAAQCFMAPLSFMGGGEGKGY